MKIKKSNAMLNYSMGNPLLVTFVKGLLYVFSLERNPLREYVEYRKSKSDMDRICDDWNNVGNDIRKAYEKYKATSATF